MAHARLGGMKGQDEKIGPAPVYSLRTAAMQRILLPRSQQPFPTEAGQGPMPGNTAE